MQDEYLHAIHEAQAALKIGDKSSARGWANKAAELAPDKEDPWLILAAVASPRASIEYLNHALLVNPTSQRARQGMHWAVQRLRANETPTPVTHQEKPLAVPIISSENLVRKRSAISPWLFIFLVICLGLFAWAGTSAINLAVSNPPLRVQAQSLEKATRTPLPDPTETYLPAMTDTPTEVAPPTATDIPTSTSTPILIPSETPEPLPTEEPEIPTDPPLETEPPEPTLGPNGLGELPHVQPGEHWIDVDLSQQRVYAYEGDQIVDTFLVSTGKNQTPTVRGQYRIYVKYREANMSGPDYFLPDVPFVMYFYKGYGLHGTYWHTNFGTPMSHGCVNLKTKEARWLFEWASVGTIVNVHK